MWKCKRHDAHVRTVCGPTACMQAVALVCARLQLDEALAAIDAAPAPPRGRGLPPAAAGRWNEEALCVSGRGVAQA